MFMPSFLQKCEFCYIMCGIAGFIRQEGTVEEHRALAEHMLAAITHRGPEHTSIWTREGMVLGHNRLKIIDLSDDANQPFVYQHITLVFNGEIYNYIEIKAELVALGYTFQTASDTEVICAAYIAWGDDCVQRFIGMWAFALWDERAKRLLCSRDRFGIKPFYYIQQGRDFYFGSEYKALKPTPVFDGQLNADMIQRGMTMGWAVYRAETYYSCIHNLPPAHHLIYHDGQITLKQYWDIDLERVKTDMSWDEKKATFYNLFEESVRLHSRSDVRNGTCLSGGLDSSAISGMYGQLFPQGKIKAFSIYYEGAGAVDERPFIREVINKYPLIEPHYFSPSDNDIADHFERVAYHADVPLLGSSYISQYFLMRLAKESGVTVVLDGQGSDEYLGGYLHSFYRVFASQLSSLDIGGLLSTFGSHIEREGYTFSKGMSIAARSAASLFYDEDKMYQLELSQASRGWFGSPAPLHFERKTGDRFDNFLYHLLLNTTLQTLLHFEDRNSMAFSLESRVPFLNHKLVEFAFSLTQEDRINEQAETKYILREALQPVLPQAVYARKDKKGFVTPGEVRWLNGPLAHLLDIDYSALPAIKPEAAKACITSYQKGDHSQAKMAWRIACLHYWVKQKTV
jgi:asparagine synthase (glutamine-hydrolysing)